MTAKINATQASFSQIWLRAIFMNPPPLPELELPNVYVRLELARRTTSPDCGDCSYPLGACYVRSSIASSKTSRVPDESARFKRREKKCGKMQHCPFGRISYNLAYSRCGCTP